MSYQQKISSVVFVFLSIALSACGGGGGGGGEQPNNAPTAIAQTVSTLAGSNLDITLTGSDADNDSLIYAIASQPANGTLNGTAPNVTYTPNDGYRGADSFTFTVNDGTVTSSAATVDIDVNNNVPTANSQDGDVHAGNSVTFNLTGADLDNDAITFAIVDSTTNGEIVVTEGDELDDQNTVDVTYTPNEGYVGDDSFTFTVSDGTTSSEAATVSISVNNVAPTATAQNVSTQANVSLNITLSGSDVDGDSLGFAVEDSPTNGALSGAAPNLIYTPNNNFVGSDSFTFIVNDGVATSAAAIISIEVTNLAPTASSQSVSTKANIGVEIILVGQDGNGDPLTYNIVSNPTNGSISGAAPVVTYTPNTNYAGSDSFTFTVSDGMDISAPATVSVNVTNTTPIATAQNISVVANTDSAITLAGTDSDGDALTFAIDAAPTNGAISGTAPNITYTPNTNFTGNDSFTFTVSDGVATSSPATVDINVPDTLPEAFSFTDIPEIAPNTEATSEVLTITGLGVGSVVSITGGEYSINGGTYTAANGTISNNQNISVRLTSSATAAGVAEATLDIGGVQDTFSVTTSSDTTAPSVDIVFPTMSTFTTGRVVRVRGTTTDDGTVASVSVNGFAATSEDDFANWIAVVDLSVGDNTLTAQATDLGGNTSAVAPSIGIESVSILSRDSRIEYNNTSDNLLVFDNGIRALLEVDSVNKKSRVITSQTAPDDINPIAFGRDFILDEVTDSAFVLDANTTDRVASVDLASGSRNIITEDANAYPTHALVAPAFLEVDTVGNHVYVLDSTQTGSGRRGIMRFDLTTGEGSIFSDNTFPQTDSSSFQWPDKIALDLNHSRILVAEKVSQKIIAVDIATGARSTLSGNGFPDDVNLFVYPKALVVDPDPDNNRAFVYDIINKRIIAIALDTGARTIAAENIDIGSNYLFLEMDMVFDGANNNLYLSQSGSSEIYKVDLVTGAQTVFSSATVPDSVNPLSRPWGLTLDSVGNRLLVTDGGRSSVIAVSLVDGARQIVSSNTIPNDLNALRTPKGIDFVGNTGYLINGADLQLLTFDITTGARDILSDNTTPDADNTFMTPFSVANDVANNQILVSDIQRKSIVGVDKSTGARVVVSSNDTPNADNPLGTVTGMVMQGGRALVVDFTSQSILSIDLSTGTRTVFSGPGVPDNNFLISQPLGMALDEANGRVLVVDRNGVIAVSLADGSRTRFSTNTIPDRELTFSRLRDITIDSINGLALVFDEGYKNVLAIDLATGIRRPYYGTLPAEQVTLIDNINHISFDVSTGKALVTPSNVSGGSSFATVDLDSGIRQIIANNDIPAAGDNFPAVFDIEFDSANRAILLGLNALYEINTVSGVRSLISDNTTPNADTPFPRPSNITIDRAAQVAYAANGSSILAVDLSSGQRTLISDNSIPDANNPFVGIRDIVFDAEMNANRLWALDGPNIVQVDIDTGIRTPLVLSGASLSSPTSLLMDEANDRLLIADQSRRAIYGVELATGIVTQLTRINFGPSTNFRNVGKMTFTSQENVILLKDRDSGVMMVDLVSGEQVIISK